MTNTHFQNAASFKTREECPQSEELVVSALLSSPPPLQRFLHRCQLSLGQVLTGTTVAPPVAQSRSTCRPRINGRNGTTRHCLPLDMRASRRVAPMCAGPLAVGRHAHGRPTASTSPGSPPRMRSGRAFTATKEVGKTRGFHKWGACNSTPAFSPPTARSFSRPTGMPGTGLSTRSYSRPSVPTTATTATRGAASRPGPTRRGRAGLI